MKKILAATVILGLVSTPVLAQSVAAERTPSPVEKTEKVAGGSGIILGIVAAAAVIAGIIIATNGSKDLPTSP